VLVPAYARAMNQVFAFALLSLVLILIPGPSLLFTIGRALTVGRRAALMSVAGNATGVYLQVVAVALGIGAIVARSAAVFTVIKFAGALYLVYLGVQAIRHRQKVTDALAATVSQVSPVRALRDGMVVGFTNPKTIVFLVVVLPEFTDGGVGQILLVGALFPLIAVLCDGMWAFAAGTARMWFTRSPRRLAAIGGTGGLMMIGLGASLALTSRKD
jgi:threonine/homoserine/homoserine lactone efflux protein